MPAKLKDPEVRARRNKASTATELPAPGSPELRRVKAPPLNAKLLGIKGSIKPPVQRWWRTIWASPMAPRWLTSDVEGLYGIALLRQQMIEFAAAGKSVATILGEIRQQEARFGLDVLARRRLDWRIEAPRHPDAPAPEATKREPTEIDDSNTFDPRAVLRAVK